MSILESILLGIIQGLTEFLPISSSGHLELGQYFFGLTHEDNLSFDILVHGATMLSTIIVFRKEIIDLIKHLFTFRYDEKMKYIIAMIVSAIPVAIAGVFFKDYIKTYFNSDLMRLGIEFIFSGLLLFFIPMLSRTNTKKIDYKAAFMMGIAQMVAILPAISRSGATIATGLAMGIDKKEVAKFSFLMVLIPIFGANLLEVKELMETPNALAFDWAFLPGVVMSFISGLLACKFMISYIQNKSLKPFALYCFAIGLFSIIYSLL